MDQRVTVKPPPARKADHFTTLHGRRRNDPYHWLRAENWRDVMRDPALLAPDIRDWLERENAYSHAVMADTAALRETLVAEMRGRIKEDDSSVPAPDGPYAYYVGYVEGAEHPRYCRAPRDGGAGEVLIDGEALAAGKSFFRLGGVAHSPDHALVAYGFDETGSEYYTLRLRETATGRELDDTVTATTGGVAWAADGRSFFYVWNDDNHRPCKVYHHAVGTPAAADTLIYEEPDPGFFVSVGETQSRGFIVVSAHDHETAEARLIDPRDPLAPPRLVAAREPGHEYHVEHHGDRLVILTNADGAEDFRIAEAPLDAPDRAHWRDIVAHRPGRLILAVTPFRDHMVRLEREDGLPRIVVTALADGAEHAVAFDEAAYSLGLDPGYEFATTNVRFTYASMATPAQIFDYDMATRERTLRKTQEVPSGHDPSAYETRRLMVPAADGETVPVSLLYRRDTPLDGSAPCLLYGYGAYGIAVPAAFNTNRLSLVDRGFVYAVAHVRGGKDKGYRWYREGKRAKKANTFTDFVAAAEHLVAEGYTSRGNIVAHGGSAGGMLIGAVANMAPELFAGLVAEVPFVDVLNTMLDASLPLTPPEWPEWGNPIDSADDYATIAAYSPYDNVRAGPYPHILALAGLSDPRVTYWEPAKWVARLRALKTDDNLLLLHTNMDAGHAGAAGRFDRLKEVALIYAFALKITDRA